MGTWTMGMPREAGVGAVRGWDRELPAEVGCSGSTVHSFVLFCENTDSVTVAGPATQE